MPQDFFEPRTPVKRTRPPGLAAGRADAGRDPAAPAGQRPPDTAVSQAAAPTSGGAEPSWARIYWNTLRSFTRRRLGLRPRPVGDAVADGGRSTAAGSRRRVPLIATALLVVAALAVTAVVLSRSSGTGASAGRAADGGGAGRPGSAGRTAATPPQVRDAVTEWIVGHVGPGQVVACDVAVCAALTGQGFPASSTVPVQLGAQDVQSADVAVLTPTLRARLGAAVDQVTAAQPLAVFGTGAGTATVAAVAHAGRAAYDRALTADRGERRSAGAQLLSNRRISLAPAARAELATGQVDMRTCALLATLGAGHTLTVASFGAPAPRAGADVARAGLEISTVDGRPAAGASGPAAALRSLIAAQQAPFKPLTVLDRTAATGSSAVLSVLYSQPSPLGVDGSAP